MLETRKRQRLFRGLERRNVPNDIPVVKVASSWEDLMELLEQDFEVSIELEDEKFVLVSRGRKREDV